MGLQLPGELVSLLGMLGYDWPTSDEEKLFYLGQEWLSFAQELTTTASTASQVAAPVWTASAGSAVSAFKDWWEAEDSPPRTLADGARGAMVTGLGLIVCASLVLALKIQIIVQLVILAIQIAQAIATAAPTFGASLAQIPVFKMITSLIIDQIIDQVTNAVLGG